MRVRSSMEVVGGTERLRRALHAVWAAGCVTALTLLIGGRWLRYASGSTGPGLDHLLRETMVFEQQAFLWSWVSTIIRLPSVLLVLVVLLVGFQRRLVDGLVRRVGGVWRLTPLGMSVLLGALVWVQYLFDANPTIAAICATSLVLATLSESPSLVRALPAGLLRAAWALAFVAGLVLAGDPSERVTLVVWAIVLLATHRFLVARLGRIELPLLRFAAVLPMNLLPAVLPLVLPIHGGTFLGAGLAYSFCEVPGRNVLYAAVPVCDSVRTSYEDCRDGKIVEYDLRTMQRVATRDLISPDFYGRLELLVCLDDEVQVAVQGAVREGRDLVQAVLSFPAASPDEVSLLTAAGGLGTTIAYDRRHDAFFYSGEFDNPIIRYDRQTKQFDDRLGQEFVRRWIQPVSLEAHTGSLALHTNSIHPGRNRLYLADWMQGRWAYALDLTTLRVVGRYPVGGGGSLGLTVDPEGDRLYVSSLWGLEVIDLKTEAVVARKRLGLGNRPVVIDPRRNRVYVSSMIEGKVRILDRDTLDVIGQIPIGFGSRYLGMSLDGKYLFASSTAAHFYWDADTLAGSSGAMRSRTAVGAATIPHTSPETTPNATVTATP